ncbi:c-type cytochrome [Marinicella rhabdoformis]|uniref:c-type cytochrome n=1 Tax=Marinicella rhabdoformis TaxID=2580566 RepID=UPI0012AEC785|nr:c-type cytochrome [Marinicella rhabdoformis]
MSDQDSIFFRNFSILLAVLILLTIILAVGASMFQDNLVENLKDRADRSGIQADIKPAASVNTDPNAVVEVAVAQVAPFDGSTDGEMIYNNVCAACHGTGAGGAPKLEAAAWAGRLDKGSDAVLANAINGYTGDAGMMPAKGGRADLTDEQVQAAVEFMTSSL